MNWRTFFFLAYAFVFCVSIFGTSASSVTHQNPTYQYKIQEFEVPVDHFNFLNEKTFKIRYLYNDSYIDEKSDLQPIFFYTGNEGDIELFAENTGFMWELAKNMKAYIVFAEHRYYGKSLPFGASTFNVTENLSYLSVEQTLEDYALLIRDLTGGKQTMPVVAFGGSYGGMLAAWLRMKYPHLVVGALAASAPIRQFHNITDCDILPRITTSVFTTSLTSNCSLNIKNSWNILKNLSTTDDGRKQLNSIFNFCNPLKQPNDVTDLLNYLEDVYGNLAMANYPYENTFLAPLPAYPVRQFCVYLKEKYNGIELVKALQSAVSVYSNYTGNVKCLETKAYQPSLGDNVWEIQTCNQMVMPMCSKDTMFMDDDWDFKKYSDECFKKFKLRPKLNDITLRYGGKDLNAASNIIFSNGLLDPWSGGGVLYADNEKITIIIIPEGAHHIDLRSSNPKDPNSVIETRKQEAFIIRQWISEV